MVVRMNVRVDERGVSRITTPLASKIGADKAIPDECVNTAGDLTGTPRQEVAAVVNDIQPRQEIALDYLRRVAADMVKVRQVRAKYAVAARRYGLTNQQIGDALGVTEAAVRHIVKTAVDG